MNSPQEVYTYRGGQRMNLVKLPDQFVVRTLPEKLEEIGITNAERVSSASSRVTSRSIDLEREMSQSRYLAPTHHAYQIADTGEDFLITDRIFVTFRQPISAEELDAFAGRYGLLKKQTFSDRDYLFQLTDHTGINPVKLVVKLNEEEPIVEIAEHDLNYIQKRYQFQLPTDPYYKQQWHLHTQFIDSDFNARSSANCEAAWQLLDNFGSADVVVGVTDDGCKLDHPDFNSPEKFAGWGYFVGEGLVNNRDINANPASMYQFGSNHGTACAGVIAAEIDAALTVGAAPGCKLFPIKWESSGPGLFISDSKLLTAFNYLADKVDVISNSWGSTPTTIWSTLVTRRIAELAQSGGRRGRGIIFLWAAGNENCPIQHTASIDVPYDSGWEYRNGSWVWVGVSKTRVFQNNLVGIPGVMHVAALASIAQRSHYSNYGTGIDICAASNNVHEYARVSVRGLGITTTTGESSQVDPEFGGTSSATPLVAGIAALVISANPELSSLEVISLLKKTATKNLDFTPYPKTPPATYDPNPTWDVSPVAPFDTGEFKDIGSAEGTWSPWFGHGKVDAAAAVAEALKAKQPPSSSQLKYQSNPAKAIPDNNSTGVEDLIRVPNTGHLRDLRINLDITHTWIGDLRVQLKAPNSNTIVLHDRAGSNQQNLQKTYDIQTTPALASLRKMEIKGDWLIQVADVAAQDIGTLQNWGVEIEVGAAPMVVEDSQAIQIPDNNPNGIVRILSVSQDVTIEDLTVFVDITHPYIGDLKVILVPPKQPSIVLHDRAGGNADNLVRAWNLSDLPALAALRGTKAGGTWQLQVADLAGQDIGKLDRWRLEILGK